jgi:hypothetical protein
MIKKISPFLLLICAISAIAQTDSTLSFIAYWKKGDIKYFNISQNKSQHKNDSLQKNDYSSYTARVEVKDSTAEGYLFSWQVENSILDGLALSKSVEEIAKKYDTLSVLYRTNDAGAFQEIVNWKELRNSLLEMFDALIQEDSAKTPKLKEIMEPVKVMFSTQENITNLVFKEIQLIHYPMGLMFQVKDTIFYKEELSNPLGGDPIQADAKFYFNVIDRKKHLCQFENTLKMDTLDFKRMTVDLFQKMLSNNIFESVTKRDSALNSIKNEMAKLKVDIRDSNVYIYEYNPGWPIKISTQRKSIVYSGDLTLKKVDKLLIEQISQPTPKKEQGLFLGGKKATNQKTKAKKNKK